MMHLFEKGNVPFGPIKIIINCDENYPPGFDAE
jgi:hypothetical protein